MATFFTTKDPFALLDYSIDWTEWLATATDTIQASTWLLSTGLTNFTDSHTANTTTIWISGGTIGEVYLAENNILTVGGRNDSRTIQFTIIDK